MKPQKAVLLKTRDNMIAQLLFAMCVAAGVGLFAKRIGFIRRNILQGQDVNRSDRATDRWKVMARVALGQGKMVARPVAGVMHIMIYVGFVVINIELLEIVIDGLLGTHRVFAFLGPCLLYTSPSPRDKRQSRMPSSA